MIEGIKKGPKGQNGVAVTFEIGLDGTLNIDVKEKNGDKQT